ncbi:Glucose/ribitol dehydrogenase [Penicillium cf. viridicatum]|uniref:Glucose/ribitol dehydrogenase n=1 Tax=Penicillium cf. viridicatum TaxID=2972119 RepID=A0A9W9JAG1_9EURO|nr:Glucose/ribitol dehydrogenase [Penicillium cf. viridicatum]
MTQGVKRYTGLLSSKVVLIIGGTSGIGYAVAEGALEHGALVTLVGSNKTKLEDALSKLREAYPLATSNGQLRGFQADLSCAETLDATVPTLLKYAANGAKINHLVVTAADMTVPPPIHDVTVQNINSTNTLRFFAPLILTKHLPQFMEKRADNSVTLTSGAHGQKADPGWSVIAGYCGAIEGLMRGLAVEMKPLRFNVVSPGPIVTQAVKDILGEHYEAAIKVAQQKALVGEAGSPEKVAQAYLYLMKDGFVTGTVLESNGGFLLT